MKTEVRTGVNVPFKPGIMTTKEQLWKTTLTSKLLLTMAPAKRTRKLVNKSYQTLCKAFQGTRRLSLIDQLVERYSWPATMAEEAVTHYVMFLSLAAEEVSRREPTPLVPTTTIDKVWEVDILKNTADYIQLCKNLCGEVIHHANEGELKPLHGFKNIETAFSLTQTLFIQHFGENILDHRSAQIAACGVLIKAD